MNLFPVVDESKSIFLRGNVPSSKNSKEIGFYFLSHDDIRAGKKSNWLFNQNGTYKMIRPSLRNSDIADEYIKMIVDQIILGKPKFKELIKDKPKPLRLQLHFVRDSKRDFDFHNMVQIIGDCLSGHYWEDHKTIPHIATKWIWPTWM